METAKPFLVPVDKGNTPDRTYADLYISCVSYLENHDVDDKTIDTIFEILSEALKRYSGPESTDREAGIPAAPGPSV
ncbi:MAG: hypothetical protein ABGY96_06340 [bacterium]|nr:hypothetical protein [Gammaproteobacteria bacterium]HIL94780.1 hypothetical protein [Pseudomonadales bacterium]